MVKKLLSLTLFLLSNTALAQDIPNHAIPIGRGPGVVGFGTGGPCGTGQALIWSTGPTADPTCQGIGTSSLTVGTTGIAGGTNQALLTINSGVLGSTPAPTRAGDVLYWNGTIWTSFAGNNSGTQVFSENASGVPSWTTIAAGVSGPGSSTNNDVACWNGTTGLTLRDASAGACLTPGGLTSAGVVAITNTTDGSTGGLSGALQVTGGATIGKQLDMLASGEPAIEVANCNINALTQLSPFGRQENIAFFDCVDAFVLGATQDNGRVQILVYDPINLFKYHMQVEMCATTLDSRIVKTELIPANTGTQTFTPPCLLNYAPNTTALGDGATWNFANMSLNMPARTNIYFILNATDNRNMDIRFGVSQISSGDITGAGCYFMVQNGSVTANTRYVCTDGTTTVNNDTGVNTIQNRREYMVQIVPGTPAGGNPKVNFWCGDVNNVLQACGSINVGTAGLPNDVVNLVPFFRIKENANLFTYTVSVNEVYVITEQ